MPPWLHAHSRKHGACVDVAGEDLSRIKRWPDGGPTTTTTVQQWRCIAIFSTSTHASEEGGYRTGRPAGRKRLVRSWYQRPAFFSGSWRWRPGTRVRRELWTRSREDRRTQHRSVTFAFAVSVKIFQLRRNEMRGETKERSFRSIRGDRRDVVANRDAAAINTREWIRKRSTSGRVR